MSNSNPTPIRVGTYGTFNGVRYLVAGRLVMGMELDGERYFWNEFNLVSDNGDTATLVHEEGEHGVEWRIFVLFEPEFPRLRRASGVVERCASSHGRQSPAAGGSSAR